jgi:hypothetical protein
MASFFQCLAGRIVPPTQSRLGSKRTGQLASQDRRTPNYNSITALKRTGGPSLQKSHTRFKKAAEPRADAVDEDGLRKMTKTAGDLQGLKQSVRRLRLPADREQGPRPELVMIWVNPG